LIFSKNSNYPSLDSALAPLPADPHDPHEAAIKCHLCADAPKFASLLDLDAHLDAGHARSLDAPAISRAIIGARAIRLPRLNDSTSRLEASL
jgi:hypothetical protein